MQHFYQSIPGWFDFPDLYKARVSSAVEGAHFVEVGCYLGKSTAYLAVEILKSGKAITLDVIDTFEGVTGEPGSEFVSSPEFVAQQAALAQHGSIEPLTRANLAPVAHALTIRPGDSLAMAHTYADASLDFVFLDNNHDATHVLAELDAWWPKIKPGGVLAGHDLNWKSVKTAVDLWRVKQGQPISPVSSSCWSATKSIPATTWAVPDGERRCLVAVCSNERTIYRQTAESLVRLGWGQRVLTAGERHGFADIGFAWFSKHVLVSALRDEAAMCALDGGYTHVLFLDADMTWPSDVLTKMLAHHARGIVSGLYHLKIWPHWPVALRDGTWNALTGSMDYTYDEMAAHAEVIRRETLVGMGCTLIPVEVFRRLPRPWFKYQDDVRGLGTVTEDVWFCQQAATVDCPIWLDPTVVCGHIAAETIGVAHFDRSTYEMAMLGNGQRLQKTEPLIKPKPKAVRR